jgi:hypothetical protein
VRYAVRTTETAPRFARGCTYSYNRHPSDGSEKKAHHQKKPRQSVKPRIVHWSFKQDNIVDKFKSVEDRDPLTSGELTAIEEQQARLSENVDQAKSILSMDYSRRLS